MKDFTRLLKYVRPHWLTFLIALIAMILMAVFETATGALLVPIFDQFLPNPGKESKTLFDLHSLIPQNDWYDTNPISEILSVMNCRKSTRQQVITDR